MAEFDRQDVIERDLQRRALRQSLKADVDEARHDLHPRTLSDRWIGKQKRKLGDAGQAVSQKIAKNAPLIGLAGAAILLFAARRPISELVDKIRSNRTDTGESEQ